jgi:branched-chain amino acid transport system ATP-binding protein
MSDPKLLLLDEPTLGLAPTLVDVIFELLATLRGEGRTLLVVEQNARRALALADRGYVLRTGRIVATGSGAEMAATADLFATFLGDTA